MGGYLLLLALLGATPPADTAKAEALTRRCIVEYNGGEFDDALRDAKKAYALQPAPLLLYNLGQIHRALHHWEEAAFSYRAYLREQPNAPNRATVEAHLAEVLKKQSDALAAQKPPLPPAPWPQAPPAPAAAAVPAPKVAVVAKPQPRIPRIAVLDVRPHGGVTADFAQGVTSVVVLNVRKTASGATVVGADEIRAMIGLEHQKQLLGCTESSCLAEIGGALGADRLVIGSLSRFGETYLLDLKLLDSHTAKVLAEGSARFQQEDALPDAVAQSVDGLFPKAAPSPVDASVRPELTESQEAPPNRTHALAWSLFAASGVATGFAIYGAVRVAQVQGAINTLNEGRSTSVAAYQSNLPLALQSANAQNWQIGAIVLGVVAAATAVTGIFTW
jgi:tetratricopeptide (TPR) repeat protein